MVYYDGVITYQYCYDSETQKVINELENGVETIDVPDECRECGSCFE